MWYKVSKFILRFRAPLFVLLCLITVFMGYKATGVQLDYSFSKVIPQDHPKFVEYINFKKEFGEDGDLLIAAVQRAPLFELDFYNRWARLSHDINAVDGIEDVISIANAYQIVKDPNEKKFVLDTIPAMAPRTQAEVREIEQQWNDLPFYKNVIYDPDEHVTILAARFDQKKLDSGARNKMVLRILDMAKEFEEETGTHVHLSGLPFIRTHNVVTASRELLIVLILAVALLIFILLLLFRSASAVIFPMVVVGIGVTWGLGLINLLGYKITLLTALVPNLIVIISIPNCVYLLNKYHTEFKKHGNKMRALSRIIERIGYTTFFANLTTAIGFVVFYFTGSKILQEFGIVAGIMISAVFLITLVTIPIVFSYLPEPRMRHINYLDNMLLNKLLDIFSSYSTKKRPLIFGFAAVVLMVSIVGIFRLETRGYILDDVPHDSQVYKDLKFMESKLKGIMPVEILIDTKEKGGALKSKNLKKMEALQDSLYEHPWFSKPSSVVDGLKFATQAYFNGNPDRYRLPKDNFLTPEMPEILTYMKGMEGQGQLVNSFVDSSRQVARISIRIPDMGSHKLDTLRQVLHQKVEAIFPPEDYDVTYTGTSIVAYEGYRFLTNGLIKSVMVAFLLIAGIMGYLFRSFRMLLLSLIPNLIPLFLTAGIMGFFNIPLKPSTVLVFSVAFGISVDFTIHFLAKYRQELARHDWNSHKTVADTIHETGVSMIYTSLILFAGFITFMASSFDGTKYMGLLVSITLAASLFSNMLLLPSLLLTFDKIVQKKKHILQKKEPNHIGNE